MLLLFFEIISKEERTSLLTWFNLGNSTAWSLAHSSAVACSSCWGNARKVTWCCSASPPSAV
ncbi:MAG: hypothetical protein U0903_17075 [Planctomycetales bacterium]